ncbi:AAA domain containing protein [uncultured Caudovirales phage]|uniref:AAA domain containing protein n=1 Tax=uncultured Caudovirales phage TaxID=2100421 RepID=A0A6J7WQN1_9CAUD|nr:AAA domain containing protein [uncultured Caudovirales phage]
MASSKSSTRSKAASPAAPALPQVAIDRIPNISRFDTYVPRDLPNGMTDIETLESYWNGNPDDDYLTRIDKRKGIRLEGPTGVGKTRLVEAFAAYLQVPLWIVECAGDDDSSSFFGSYAQVITPEGEDKLAFGYGIIPMAAKYGGILYLDEDNFTDASITAALHSLLDFRKSVKVKRHYVPFVDTDGSTQYIEEIISAKGTNLMVIGASNPGYNGTSEHNQAFRNRFEVLEFNYDPYLESQFVPECIVQFAEALRFNKDAVWSPVGLNRLVSFHEDIELRSYDHAVYALLSYFQPDERPVVQNLLNDTYYSMIAEEYGLQEEAL